MTHRPAAYRYPSRCLVETVHQRARRLGVSDLTVRRRIREGTVKAVQIGGSWRIPTAPVSDLPDTCTVRQVANSLNVAELTVRRWISSGVLPASKTGRIWTIERRDLQTLLLVPDAPGQTA
jgi:excisionase family DNA binding protein